MDFVTAIKTCLNKYVDFNGRASRSEYWWFVLAVILAQVVAGIIGGIIGLNFLPWIVWLAVIVPTLAVAVRRLHDLDKPWVWILLGLIPVVGLYLIYLFVQPGTPGPNQFGENPLPQTAAAV